MKTQEIEWITSCLSERIVYSYYKDRYAIDLLRYVFKDGTPINEIKRSGFGGLLNKPVSRELTQKFGDGRLDHNVLKEHWSDDTSFLSLTLGTWGSERKGKFDWAFDQVSRPEMNLVLQVNFGMLHDAMFYKSMGKDALPYMLSKGHPVNNRFCTLGWVRLDVDMDRNEVLIEEVQSDWIRNALYLRERLECTGECCEDVKTRKAYKSVESYFNYLHPFVKQYREILLASALYFIYEELGLTDVWYHSNESGIHYKMLRNSFPPRSIYKQLPEKFGFTKTAEKPQLIENCAALKKFNRKAGSIGFYHLRFNK